MDQPVCKLTLVYLPASEAHIVELMLNADPPLQGFTTFEAEGHGHSFSNATMRERVRGRIARGMLIVVLPRVRVPSLLDEIRVKAAIADLVYWVEPVDAFGRLAPVTASSHGADTVTE